MPRANVLRLLQASRMGTARAARGKLLSASARPFAAAAIRIPERVSSQLALVFPGSSPQLYVHEGARQSLERKLQSAFPGPVTVSITDNRHSIISHSCKGGVLRARIHHMFLDAPANVVDALVRYIVHGEREASALVGFYIESNTARLAPRSRKLELLTKGKHHDLLDIMADVNERYFDGGVNAVITWGKRAPSAERRSRKENPRRSIKLGSYSGGERIIRVHPSLDRKWVPRYFVAYIVYHEMLHHVVPAAHGETRTLLHPPEFVLREKHFRHYERALAWEKDHITRLLRS
jgi:hypothetical protein